MKNSIENKLQSALSPEFLEVVDESHLHHGHAGWREGGNTHFKVSIKSSSLDGLSRVMKHKKVMKCLDEEFEAGLHALSINFID